jgi:hypothetical protein
MKLLSLLAVAILLISVGCIKTNAIETAGAGQVEKTQEQKQEVQKQGGVDLGISNSDLQIDDPGLDPTTDSSEDLERP